LAEFFWKIIAESNEVNEELLENCITKFAEMIRYWTLDQKKPFFARLPEQMKKTEFAALPILNLFKKLITDEKGRVQYSGGSGSRSTSNKTSQSYRMVGGVSWGKLLAKIKNPQCELEGFYDKLTYKQKLELVILMKAELYKQHETLTDQ
jgi:hypothetical protein